MSTTATIIQWLMACLSIGPLLLAVLMLVLLRDRGPKRTSAASRTRKKLTVRLGD
jgi:hypothetical protein